MMYYDALVSNDGRTGSLFEGQLVVYVPQSNTLLFVDFARTLLEQVLAPHAPNKVQGEMSIEENIKESATVFSVESQRGCVSDHPRKFVAHNWRRNDDCRRVRALLYPAHTVSTP